jgi:ribosomal protein S18 acetylase RimI-like enzyme
MDIFYSTAHDDVEWPTLKRALADDGFDNGRTPAQLERSFRASFRCVYALDGKRVVGTARALSDGVCNAYVVDLWTQSAYRRRGIGRRMLDILCEPLAGQHVYLFTDDRSDFYTAAGFVPRGQGMERIVGEWLQISSRR